MKTTLCTVVLPILLILRALPAAGQVPDQLKFSIPAPFTAQEGANLGASVGVDGGYTVVGAPRDAAGRWFSEGVVKIFDSTTGYLLFVLNNPGPAAGDFFGYSVAISGTRVVVGAYGDDTGATDAGSAYVYDLSGGTPTVPVATLNNPGAAAGDNFGYSVAISATRVVVGAYADDTGAADAGSAYVYDLSSGAPTVAVATLNKPGPAAFDIFGYSVAISGTRVVVGAYGANTGVGRVGSAYVYDLSGTPTAPVATLNSPGTGDNFGTSVAISGTRVVVGAYETGSAYVYDLSSGTPTVPVTTLNKPGPVAGENFGYTVAISGTRVVIGAYTDDTGAYDAGSAYVYDLSSGTPTVAVDTLNNPGPAWGDNFGYSVAISGTRVVVGAYKDDTGASDAGSAYVYDLANATPTVPVAILNNPGPALNDNFGNSVAISGMRVVVGAYNKGSAYVYDLSSGTPTAPVATLTNPPSVTSDHFGVSVAISGTRVVVGAYRAEIGRASEGNAYVYDLNSAEPNTPVATLNNPGPEFDDYFGYSVAISGTRVVVGAAGKATNVGSAYVYDLSSGTPTVPVATLDNPGPAAGDYFGISVAISGTRVVVGADQNDAGATNAGSAYVYDLNSGTPTVPVRTLNNPGPATNDYFGGSVAISGTRVVVGAGGNDFGVIDAGSAYVYDLSSGTPTVPAAVLNNPGPASGDYFGGSVAISGTRVVVGSDGDDTGASAAGSAYVYDFSSGTPTVPVATLNNPGPATSDRFGYSVAISGATVAIGAPLDDTVALNKGAAYIFGPYLNDHDSDGLLDSWELTYWPTITGHGPLDDSDHDGYGELLELAFGTNPLVPDAGAAPAFVDEGGYLTVTLTKRAGVLYTVQSASDLADASFSAATTTVLLDNATTLKARDNAPTSSLARHFLRVTVTAAP